MATSRHLLLAPSLACPASCEYCFGPHEGRARMSRETLEAVVRWQVGLGGDGQPLEITFHGGEPLVPGVEFYRMALPLLRNGLSSREVRFAMQSNLWLLTDKLAGLLREHSVSVGTSLDSPEAINDVQRGAGYFRRTMAGIERACSQGLDVGCICTFTRQSLPHIHEILSFFIREGLNFTLHAALPALSPPLRRCDPPGHRGRRGAARVHPLAAKSREARAILAGLCQPDQRVHASSQFQ